jgi:hypothetical protein
MALVPDQAYIYKYNCNNEGRHISCQNQCQSLSKDPDKNKPHYFIILTSKDYNSGSHFVLGVPLTSKNRNEYARTFGFSIEGSFKVAV